MAVPLVFVLAVSMVKDVYEDYQRKKQDNEENNKRVLILDDMGNFVLSHWRDIRVGNVIKVMEDELIPADIIIVNATNPKGICYVETKNLDGETNLKTKQCEKSLYNEFKEGDHTLKGMDGEVVCDAPNNQIYNFNGNI